MELNMSSGRPSTKLLTLLKDSTAVQLPHDKINKSNTNKGEPIANDNLVAVAEPEPKKRGRPKTHGLSKTRAYVCFREAKRRCEDTNCKDFPSYGGKGIECRYSSVRELYAELGECPPEMTLDRIDPNGHYETSNVRWATPAEQTRNRRPLHWIERQSEAEAFRAAYDDRARHWINSVKYFNDQYLSDLDLEFLRQRREKEGTPDANFRPYRDVDVEGVHQGMFSLPSLESKASRVNLQGGPFSFVPNKEYRGILLGLIGCPAQLNVGQELLTAASNLRRSYQTGLTAGLVVHASSAHRSEGPLLATISRLAYYGVKTRAVTCAEVAAALSENSSEKLVRAEFLAVQDLDNWPRAYKYVWGLTEKLARVLIERARLKFPTLVACNNPVALGNNDISALFATRYLSCWSTSLPGEDLSARI
jgi:hypothetical protein